MGKPASYSEQQKCWLQNFVTTQYCIWSSNFYTSFRNCAKTSSQSNARQNTLNLCNTTDFGLCINGILIRITTLVHPKPHIKFYVKNPSSGNVSTRLGMYKALLFNFRCHLCKGLKKKLVTKYLSSGKWFIMMNSRFCFYSLKHELITQHL